MKPCLWGRRSFFVVPACPQGPVASAAGRPPAAGRRALAASPMTRRRLPRDEYVEGVLRGDRTILSRAITLIESLPPRISNWPRDCWSSACRYRRFASAWASPACRASARARSSTCWACTSSASAARTSRCWRGPVQPHIGRQHPGRQDAHGAAGQRRARLHPAVASARITWAAWPAARAKPCCCAKPPAIATCWWKPWAWDSRKPPSAPCRFFPAADAGRRGRRIARHEARHRRDDRRHGHQQGRRRQRAKGRAGAREYEGALHLFPASGRRLDAARADLLGPHGEGIAEIWDDGARTQRLAHQHRMARRFRQEQGSKSWMYELIDAGPARRVHAARRRARAAAVCYEEDVLAGRSDPFRRRAPLDPFIRRIFMIFLSHCLPPKKLPRTSSTARPSVSAASLRPARPKPSRWPSPSAPRRPSGRPRVPDRRPDRRFHRPSLDGALAKADAISFRTPYQSEPDLRARINAGQDPLLRHAPVADAAGHALRLPRPVHWAVVEAATSPRAAASCSPSVGARADVLQLAEKSSIELNRRHPPTLLGMHDIYEPADPPHRREIPIYRASDRIGSPVITVDPSKIVGRGGNRPGRRDRRIQRAHARHRKIGQNVAEFLAPNARRPRAQIFPADSIRRGRYRQRRAGRAGQAIRRFRLRDVHRSAAGFRRRLIEGERVKFASSCSLTVTRRR
jgi:hypothetical protein